MWSRFVDAVPLQVIRDQSGFIKEVLMTDLKRGWSGVLDTYVYIDMHATVCLTIVGSHVDSWNVDI